MINKQATVIKRVINTLPGCLLVLLLAIIAYPLQNLPIRPFTLSSGVHPIEAMSIALVLGIIIGNTIPLAKLFDSGLRFCMRSLLSLGIILLGFRLNLHLLAQFSLSVIITIIAASLTAFCSALIIGRLLHINRDASLLIGIGNAICGSSAIAAVSPMTNASKDEITITIAIINLLGLISVFLFPLLAHFFSMNATGMGIWAGATVQAVPQAIACGFTFNHTAGNIATVVKLIRVLLLGPYVVIIRLLTLRGNKNHAAMPTNKLTTLLSFFPLFIILFFIVVLINTYLSPQPIRLFDHLIDSKSLLTNLSSLLLTMALAAIGIQTKLARLIKKSRRYIILGFISTLLATTITLLFIIR